jgi:hypothetical protein
MPLAGLPVTPKDGAELRPGASQFIRDFVEAR